jgi:hypothetical protein
MTAVNYSEFLASKRRMVRDHGRTVDPSDVHPSLFDFQRDITLWALRKGRAAVFADTGLGKTRIQVEWARLTGQRSLIVAPLSVARQTVREAADIGVDVRYVRSSADLSGEVNITNYEMVEQFDPAVFGAVVLDESSRLKHETSKTRQLFTDLFRSTPMRLCCTATPAPNDVTELVNHAEFLGQMSRVEMLAAYFVHDDLGWRLKGHAADPMFSWMAGWAVALRRPSDLGYGGDDRYELPPLRIIPEAVEVDVEQDGQLFATDLGGVGGRSAVRRATLAERVERAVNLASDGHQWIVWCGLNDEADLCEKAIPGAVNVPGSWAPEAKAEAFEDFQDRKVRVLITKPSIAGFGMNFQNCARMAFVGVNDSFESYYQAIRRCWRYGQAHPVDVHVVVSELEMQIVDNLRRKEDEVSWWTDRLATHSRHHFAQEVAA